MGQLNTPIAFCVISVSNFNHFWSPCDQIQLDLKQNCLFLELRLYLLSIISSIIYLGLCNLSAKLFFCQFSNFVPSTKNDSHGLSKFSRSQWHNYTNVCEIRHMTTGIFATKYCRKYILVPSIFLSGKLHKQTILFFRP